ncbi:MAG: S8 family peptidase [Nitriliruptorales bacterium]|nr:S8 family peptidase [Nitriliruptorales bacterium]
MRINRRGVVLAPLLLTLLLATIGAQSSGDPYRPQQWWLDQIGAPTAWETATGGGVVIAIVDTGVDLTHPDLVEQFTRDADGRVFGLDLIDGDDHPQDEQGHGTMVAGIAAAAVNNGVGVASVAPDARIMPIRVLDEDGSGEGDDVDEGIRWAVDNGADVINLSLEAQEIAPGAGVLQAPTDAVRYAWERGVVVVAAAGNSSNPFTDYPPNSPVVLVGATDRNDRKAEFSDSGRRDAVMAPGVDIISTWCDTQRGTQPCDERRERRYGEGDGTSFSAPQVAGAIALLRAQGLDHRQAVDRVRSTAEDLGPEGPDTETGVGRLDVAAAVGPSREPGPSPTSPSDASPSPSSGSGPAGEQTPTPAAEPTPTTRPSSPEPTGAPSPTPSPTPIADADPDVTTAPAPGTDVQGLEAVTRIDVVLLRSLAAALVVATFWLILVVRREFAS